MVDNVLGEMGAPVKYMDMMYKAVVQGVLLFGSEIWVVTDVITAFLEGFHHRIAIWIAGMAAQRGDGGEWEWDSVDTALEATRLCPMREYVWTRKSKITEYIAGRPV